MSKPIIGIVARRSVSKLERSIMYTDDDYRLAVIKAGGIPFMIMPTQKADFPYDTHEAMRDMDFDEKEELLNILSMCDGIIMPGGFRIFEYDKIICKYALENNIPILGICLGMQIMAAIDSEPEKTIELINNGVNHKSESDFAHKFILDENSKLYSIVGKKEFMVNSKHKCNIIKTNKFDIVGYSDDGIIEAIEDKEKKFAIGVQWHPEMIYDKSEEAEKLFKYFIKTCK